MQQNTKQLSQRKLALAMVAALTLIWFLQPRVSQWLGNSPNPSSSPNAAVKPQQPPPAMPDGSATATPFAPGTDPFKAHLDKNGASPRAGPPGFTGRSKQRHKPGLCGHRHFQGFFGQRKADGPRRWHLPIWKVNHFTVPPMYLLVLKLPPALKKGMSFVLPM